MAGIAQLSNLTSAQVEGLGGGYALQSSVFSIIDDKRENCGASAARLVSSLTDQNILVELFICLAQIHSTYIYNIPDDEAHQKFLAHRYDDLTHVLSQYTSMVNYFIEPEEFKKHVISIPELCKKFSINPSWAFGLWRTVMGNDVRNYESEPSEYEDEPWHPLLRDIIDEFESFEDLDWEYLKPGFYVTFWQLSLYDIQYPQQLYDRQEQKLKDQLNGSTETIKMMEKDREVSARDVREKKSERDRLIQQIPKLASESKKHEQHFNNTLDRLEREKSHWFTHANMEESANKAGVTVRRNQTQQLLVDCILPRALHSPVDAIFCAHFVRMLHSLGTVNFSSLSFYDKLFAGGILYGTLLTCTPHEAENLGLFLSEVLRDLGEWRSKIELYQDQGLGKATNDDGTESYLPGMQIQYQLGPVSNDDLLDYDNFRRALEKWHRHTCNAAVDCLNSEDYMHRRNTITMLKNMIDVFPTIRTQGWQISDAIEEISKNDTRDDLKLAARALLGHITKRESEWIELYDFKPVTEQAKQNIMAAAAKRRERSAKKQQAGEKTRKRNSTTNAVATRSSASTASGSGAGGGGGSSRSGAPTPASGPSRSGASTPSQTTKNGSSPAPSRQESEKDKAPASLPKIPTAPRRETPNDRRRQQQQQPSSAASTPTGTPSGKSQSTDAEAKEAKAGNGGRYRQQQREIREKDREKREREREWDRDRRDRDRERDRRGDFRSDRQDRADRFDRSDKRERDRDRERERDRMERDRERVRERGGGERRASNPSGRNAESQKDDKQYASASSQQQPHPDRLRNIEEDHQRAGGRGGGNSKLDRRDSHKRRGGRGGGGSSNSHENESGYSHGGAPPPPPPPPGPPPQGTKSRGGGSNSRRERDREVRESRRGDSSRASGANTIVGRKHERGDHRDEGPDKRRRTGR